MLWAIVSKFRCSLQKQGVLRRRPADKDLEEPIFWFSKHLGLFFQRQKVDAYETHIIETVGTLELRNCRQEEQGRSYAKIFPMEFRLPWVQVKRRFTSHKSHIETYWRAECLRWFLFSIGRFATLGPSKCPGPWEKYLRARSGRYKVEKAVCLYWNWDDRPPVSFDWDS